MQIILHIGSRFSADPGAPWTPRVRMAPGTPTSGTPGNDMLVTYGLTSSTRSASFNYRIDVPRAYSSSRDVSDVSDILSAVGCDETYIRAIEQSVADMEHGAYNAMVASLTEVAAADDKVSAMQHIVSAYTTPRHSPMISAQVSGAPSTPPSGPPSAVPTAVPTSATPPTRTGVRGGGILTMVIEVKPGPSPIAAPAAAAPAASAPAAAASASASPMPKPATWWRRALMAAACFRL